MSDFPIKYGKFDLLDLLAKGGMAEVYLARTEAEDPSKRKPLAIKKVLPFLSNDKDFIRMFEREIGITFHLNHSNIVQVLESGFIENSYFIAMEYIAGRTLAGIQTEEELSKSLAETAFAPYVIKEICKALSYAHNFKDPVSKQPVAIVHRDISPQNIMIGYTGKVKLFDFGIARCLIKEGSTGVGVIKGKPAYVSPEQVLGKTVDYRTDIFSLGVVLWEMLSGHRLFVHEQPLITLKNVVEQNIEPPSKWNKSVHPEMDAVVMRALERDPAKRFQSAEEMEQELDRAIRAKFQDYGADHFSWMVKYFFEQESKVAEEDLHYKLRMKNSDKPKSSETKTKIPVIPISREKITPPRLQKSNARIIAPDIKTLLQTDIANLGNRDARLAFHPLHAVLAILLFALGAYSHYSFHGFLEGTREPANTQCAPSVSK
jgi:eukaryotic-like serine/threonine-protein kinase